MEAAQSYATVVLILDGLDQVDFVSVCLFLRLDSFLFVPSDGADRTEHM